LPGETLPTWVVAIQPSGDGQTAGQMAKKLRHMSTSIIGRVEHDLLLLDPRTVAEEEEEVLLQTVSDCLAR
jgi:L-seryl-tRNA(Ser) seleniumtransferase